MIWLLNYLLLMMCTNMMVNKTPMSVLTVVISSCLILSFLLISKTMNFWLGIILIMVYMSGIMVMFMYMVSLSANEKTMTKNMTMIILSSMVMIYFFINTKMMKYENSKMSTSYKMNFLFIMMMVLMILMTAIIPPKTMEMSFKGMKSSK